MEGDQNSQDHRKGQPPVDKQVVEMPPVRLERRDTLYRPPKEGIKGIRHGHTPDEEHGREPGQDPFTFKKGGQVSGELGDAEKTKEGASTITKEGPGERVIPGQYTQRKPESNSPP